MPPHVLANLAKPLPPPKYPYVYIEPRIPNADDDDDDDDDEEEEEEEEVHDDVHVYVNAYVASEQSLVGIYSWRVSQHFPIVGQDLDPCQLN